MKKIILICVKLTFVIALFAQGGPNVQLSTVGILPFEAVGAVSAAEAAEATRRVTAEMSSWGVMTVLSGDEANNASYLVRGQISRENNEIVLSVDTVLRSSGAILNNSRQRAATLAAIPMDSFCAQIAENIPFPNFLLGRWQTTIELPDGPVSAIMEFRGDRTINVLRYDTYENDGTNSLKYEGFGSGTYTYAGYLRRTVNLGAGRQIQSDATVSIILILDDALSSYRYVNVDGLRVLFNDARTSFELLTGGLPYGINFGSSQADERLFYTQFSQIPATAQTVTSTQVDSLVTRQVRADPLWTMNLGNMVHGPPHMQAETVVLAFTDGYTISHHMSGRQLWTFDSQENAVPVIARSMEGVTYMSNNSGVFRAVNRVGRELWRVNLGRPVSHTPVVGWDGRIFIPIESMIYCHTAAGQPMWSLDLENPILMDPILDRSGSFVTVLENLDFVKVNPFSTAERLTLTEQPAFIVPLSEDGQVSYILFYSNGRAEKIVYDERATRGSRLSRGSFPSLQAPPAAAASAALATEMADQFVVTLRDGRVVLMNGAAQVLWTVNSHETSGERGSGNLDISQASMVFDERGIYSISTRGVTGFELNGRRRFIHRYNEAASVPAFCDDGMLYLTDRNNVLVTYSIDARLRTTIITRYYGPEPDGSYGLGDPPPSPWVDHPRRFAQDVQDDMLNMIRDAVNIGQVGDSEPTFVAYLMEMIGFFLNDPHYNRALPSVMPLRHIELIRLLGRMGSRETIPFLTIIFDRYHDPAVRAAAAEAIGSIGIDPHGISFPSFRFALTPNNPNRDPQLLLSTAYTIAALCRFSGPPLSRDGMSILRYFALLSWAPASVQSQIRQLIDELFNEGLDRTSL